MIQTRNGVMRDETEKYLDNLDVTLSPKEIESELLDNIQFAFDCHNQCAPKCDRWRKPARLSNMQIAMILLRKEHIKMICCCNQMCSRKYMVLSIYDEASGLYLSDNCIFERIIRAYNYDISSKDIKEVINILMSEADVVFKTTEVDLIPVNNGVFDYSTKELHEFSPEYVFTSKSPIDYDDSIALKIFTEEDGSTWDVESWMQTLSDDPQVICNMWEILSAVLRPNVHWNKAAWLYGSGNNGKGTYSQICRDLVGSESCASIPLADMGKDFMLEPLVRVSAIIVEENDEGQYIDKAANLKSIITGDVIRLNIKFENPIQIQPHVFMIQSMNTLPRTKDKSDGFYRRQLFVPFSKCFTGNENKKIKSVYLKDIDVLKYILHKVLNTNFYDFSVSGASEILQNRFIYNNEPVRQFCEEFIMECKWDFLPNNFLYEGYKAWYKKNCPAGEPQGKNTFLEELREVIRDKGTYEIWDNKQRPFHSSKSNIAYTSEPLIIEYNLTEFMNIGYRGNDTELRSRYQPPATMLGIRRI